MQKMYVTFSVNLIYFLETADKIAAKAFLKVETIAHFYRQQQLGICQNSLMH